MSKHSSEQQTYQPLLAQGYTPYEQDGSAGIFNAGPRQRRDTKWFLAYLLFVAATVACGVALVFNGSPDFWNQVSPDHLQDPNSCPAGAPLTRRRGLLSDSEDPDAAGNIAALLAHPLSAVTCTVAGSVTLGFLFVLGFRHTAGYMIRLALWLQVLLPAMAAVSLGVVGQIIPAAFLGLYCVLLVWAFWLWREQIALVGRLLAVTGHALVENAGLLGVGIVMPVVWGVTLIPAGMLAFAAVTNGSVVPNSNSAGVQKDDQGAMHCVDDQGQSVMCCAWQLDSTAKAYMVLLGVAFTWTTMLLSQIKLFTVAGTVAQWYFAAPAAPSSFRTARPRSRVLLSLRHALGPSIGSLCAGAAVLTLISYLRSALEAAESKARDENKAVAIIAMIVAAILRIILSLVEFLTRFTTVRMAITGEAFIPAAHGAVDLFRRNALNAFGVWWLPPFILGNCVVVMSALFGAMVWGASTLVYHAQSNDMSCVLLGTASFVMATVVLSFLKGLLTDILESVFVCFAMDKDMARVTREEVHMVLKEVPGIGAVVEQPDGGVAYGAPAGNRV